MIKNSVILQPVHQYMFADIRIDGGGARISASRVRVQLFASDDLEKKVPMLLGVDLATYVGEPRIQPVLPTKDLWSFEVIPAKLLVKEGIVNAVNRHARFLEIGHKEFYVPFDKKSGFAPPAILYQAYRNRAKLSLQLGLGEGVYGVLVELRTRNVQSAICGNEKAGSGV